MIVLSILLTALVIHTQERDYYPESYRQQKEYYDRWHGTGYEYYQKQQQKETKTEPEPQSTESQAIQSFDNFFDRFFDLAIKAIETQNWPVLVFVSFILVTVCATLYLFLFKIVKYYLTHKNENEKNFEEKLGVLENDLNDLKSDIAQMISGVNDMRYASIECLTKMEGKVDLLIRLVEQRTKD